MRAAAADQKFGQLRFTVRPPDLNRLFDAFFTTKADGMGMGLSICRTIVQANGGRIWASNRDSAGASFHFSVPISEERPA